MLLIKCFVHGEGPDPHGNSGVRGELHGNEARDCAKGPAAPAWSVGLRPTFSAIGSCRLDRLSLRLEVRSVPPLPLIMPSVELVATQSRSFHTQSLQQFVHSRCMYSEKVFPLHSLEGRQLGQHLRGRQGMQM